VVLLDIGLPEMDGFAALDMPSLAEGLSR
jgi:CheY-like chemotaxis protein